MWLTNTTNTSCEIMEAASQIFQEECLGAQSEENWCEWGYKCNPYFKNILGFAFKNTKIWRYWLAATEQRLRLPQNMDSNLPAYLEVRTIEWRFNFRDTFPHQHRLTFQFTHFEFKRLLLYQHCVFDIHNDLAYWLPSFISTLHDQKMLKNVFRLQDATTIHAGKCWMSGTGLLPWFILFMTPSTFATVRMSDWLKIKLRSISCHQFTAVKCSMFWLRTIFLKSKWKSTDWTIPSNC